MQTVLTTPVTSSSTLKMLAKAGKIVWPVTTNWNPKKKPFKYVDEVEGVGMRFEHKNVNYQLKYISGCFYPYLFIVN
jgi:hypothetical protein